VEVDTIFDVTFGVDFDTDIDLSGVFSGFPGDFGSARVTVKLFRGADADSQMVVYEDSYFADFDFIEEEFSFVGTLIPDTYRLEIKTAITPGGFDTIADYSFTATFTSLFVDTDSDGIEDALDNCAVLSNPDQIDADDDGYGNACDADFNNDCLVNFLDISAFSDAFLSNNPLFDLNGDGLVNFLDFSIVSQGFLQPPGPGLASGACP